MTSKPTENDFIESLIKADINFLELMIKAQDEPDEQNLVIADKYLKWLLGNNLYYEYGINRISDKERLIEGWVDGSNRTARFFKGLKREITANKTTVSIHDGNEELASLEFDVNFQEIYRHDPDGYMADLSPGIFIKPSGEN